MDGVRRARPAASRPSCHSVISESAPAKSVPPGCQASIVDRSLAGRLHLQSCLIFIIPRSGVSSSEILIFCHRLARRPAGTAGRCDLVHALPLPSPHQISRGRYPPFRTCTDGTRASHCGSVMIIELMVLTCRIFAVVVPGIVLADIIPSCRTGSVKSASFRTWSLLTALPVL